MIELNSIMGYSHRALVGPGRGELTTLSEYESEIFICDLCNCSISYAGLRVLLGTELVQ